jgi:hypothetical protein
LKSPDDTKNAQLIIVDHSDIEFYG